MNPTLKHRNLSPKHCAKKAAARFDNDFVKSNNILNGDITINLKDQDNLFMNATGNKNWVMLLCVAFEKENELKYNNY